MLALVQPIYRVTPFIVQETVITLTDDDSHVVYPMPDVSMNCQAIFM